MKAANLAQQRFTGLGMLYFVANGYNGIINSIGNVSALIDAFIIGILDGMMSGKVKDEKDPEKFDNAKLTDFFTHLEKNKI